MSNPTSAQAYLHTESVLNEAAKKAGLKSGASLRKHLSVNALQSSTTKSTGATPNIQITVQGPYERTAAVTAVQSLGDSLIAWANRYQDAKANLLAAQVTTDKAQIANLQDALAGAPDGDQPVSIPAWNFLPPSVTDPLAGGMTGSIDATSITMRAGPTPSGPSSTSVATVSIWSGPMPSAWTRSVTSTASYSASR